MDEQAEYAVLSKAAYVFFHGGEALAQLELQEYGLGDHSIDEALSDDHAVVITRPDGSAVVSYRGTDAMSDLAPDFQIALGYHHNPMLQSMGAAASQWAGDRFADARSRFGEAKRSTPCFLKHRGSSSTSVLFEWHARALRVSPPVSFFMHERRSDSLKPSSGSLKTSQRFRCRFAASGFGPSLIGWVSSAKCPSDAYEPAV